MSESDKLKDPETGETTKELLTTLLKAAREDSRYLHKLAQAAEITAMQEAASQQHEHLTEALALLDDADPF